MDFSRLFGRLGVVHVSARTLCWPRAYSEFVLNALKRSLYVFFGHGVLSCNTCSCEPQRSCVMLIKHYRLLLMSVASSTFRC